MTKLKGRLRGRLSVPKRKDENRERMACLHRWPGEK